MNRTKLDNSSLLHFQRKLEACRDEAYHFLIRADQESRALDRGDPQDLGDLCVSDLTRELLFQRCSQQRQVLNMVEEALKRIDDDTFGQCISCGDHINSKRLEAMPWTRYCLQCQEEREQLQRIKLQTRHFSGIQAGI
jgi:DnaK suppressor protein